MSKENQISAQHITNRIFTIRGEQVMLYRDLAEMYQVQVKRLNEQVEGVFLTLSRSKVFYILTFKQNKMKREEFNLEEIEKKLLSSLRQERASLALTVLLLHCCNDLLKGS